MNTLSKQSLKVGSAKAKDNEILSIREEYSLDSVPAFIKDWKAEFTERMFLKSNSTRSNWNYKYAKNCITHFEPLDELLIKYLDYLKTNPLNENDYFKYCDAYFNGQKLDTKYFRHDISKLKEYYQDIDKEHKRAKEKNQKPIPLFSRLAWERYVLFMMLKESRLYKSEYDELFNVYEEKYREYNPLVNSRSVLRAILPIKIIEHDITQANPTFIFKELGIKPFDVYAKLMALKNISRKQAKKEFNTLINLHKDIEGGLTIDEVRSRLYPIYGNRVNEVITEERFNEKGRMQKDMAKHEKEAIQAFVNANNLKNYVRLHDGLIVFDKDECEVMSIGIVKFEVKHITPPTIVNNNFLYYRFGTNEKGNDELVINPDLYSKFFKQEGFIRLSEENRDEVSIIKNENKVINRYNWETDTIHFLSNHINESDPAKISMIRNYISTDLGHIKGGFKLLEGEPLKLHRDTKEVVYIPFKNGLAEITSDEVTMIDYSNENIGFFMDCEPLEHNFEYSEESANKSDFKDFLYKAILGRDAYEITSKESDILISFCSMVGYMISNYKDPSETHAIILSDAGANEESRKGGRGKGVLQTALTKVRPSITKQGDSFKTDYTHKFADLQKEHDIFVIDDVPPNFKFNSFYSEITGGINAERKGVQAVQIPFEWSPKFIFSTNFAFRVNEEDSSTTRRFLEYQFTDYWSATHRPKDEYKDSFFNDWDSKQWNAFYSFIVECVQHYLNNGVSQIEYDKAKDNYLAYFHNEIKEEIFEKVFVQTLNNKFKDGVYKFSTTDFWKEYQSMRIEIGNTKFLTYYTTGTHIQVYADHHQLKLERDEREKRWIYTGNINQDFNSDEMPF